MRRGYGGSIPVLVALCLLVTLTAQDVDAYPYRTDHSKRSVDHYLGTVQEPTAVNSGRSFQSTFVRRQTRDNAGRLNEKAFDPEWANSNGRLNGRARRDTSKPLARSFIGLQKQGPSEEEMQSDGKIVFPGEVSRQVPTCKGSTYCEVVDNYPEALVNSAIQRNESLKYLASVDVMSEISQRIDVMDDVPLCVSTTQVICPRTAKNKDNQWKYIVNQENLKQGVLIEKCNQENVSCSMIGGTAEGYKTSCKQKYVYRQLASVLEDGTVVPDNFMFPSSCCCHVSVTANPYTRMGVIIGNQKSQVTPTKTRRRK